MNETSQLHMTIVKEEPRRHRHRSESSGEGRSPSRDEQRHEAAHSPRSGAESGHGGPARQESASGAGSGREDGHPHHHHRQYQDYGSVVLGTIDRPSEPGQPEPVSPEPGHERAAAEQEHEPSRGQLQREFYDQYSPALNRRFHKSKNVRLLTVIAAILVAIAGVVFFVARSFVVEEAPEEPIYETLENGEYLDEGD